MGDVPQGRVAEVSDTGRRVGWLLVRRGALYERGESRTYIQLLLYDIDRAEVFDDFQDDPEVCAGIERMLAVGSLEWYEESYSLDWLAEHEARQARREAGWTGPAFST